MSGKKTEHSEQKNSKAPQFCLLFAFLCSPCKRSERGFTLVEMIVAVALFSVVMLISVSTLLALIDANRKARTLQSVVNNLNVALDGMVRSMRMGYSYRCGGVDPITDGPNSCPNGGTVMSFIGHDGDAVVYNWDSVSKRIQVSKDGGPYSYLTAPEVEISEMTFYVVGTTRGDTVQPKVVMVIKGVASSHKNKLQSTFSIQSAAVQRVLDL